MATPTHVFAEIASRYGINPQDTRAVDAFFDNENNCFSAEEQIAIMEELVRRDEEVYESA